LDIPVRLLVRFRNLSSNQSNSLNKDSLKECINKNKFSRKRPTLDKHDSFFSIYLTPFYSSPSCRRSVDSDLRDSPSGSAAPWKRFDSPDRMLWGVIGSAFRQLKEDQLWVLSCAQKTRKGSRFLVCPKLWSYHQFSLLVSHFDKI